MRNYWEQTLPELEGNLETSIAGLSNQEVEKRQEKYGANQLEEGKKESVFSILFSNSHIEGTSYSKVTELSTTYGA